MVACAFNFFHKKNLHIFLFLLVIWKIQKTKFDFGGF